MCQVPALQCRAPCPIVEYLTNSGMMRGRSNGQELMTMRILRDLPSAYQQEPLQVLVNTIISSGPGRTRLAWGEPEP